MKARLQKIAAKPGVQWGFFLLLGALLGWVVSQPSSSLDDGEESLLVTNPFASCAEKLTAAERERRTLREELAYTKQSVLIEQEACFELRSSLQQQEDELGKLNEQLAFYRGIVSPEQDEAGVRIHKLELFDAGRRAIQFRLTLAQPVRQTRDAKGHVRVMLEGLSDGTFSKLNVSDLELSDGFSGLYAFRYYLELHGQFRLPKGFKPLRIVTKAIPDGKGRKPLSQTFVWQEVLTADSAKASEQ